MEKIQTKAILRRLSISPQKVRLLIDLIRGMVVAEARVQLQFSNKDAAKPVLKLLESAVANAKHNHQMTESGMVISSAFVDGGPTLHRWMPRAMGRATPIRKRTSHVTIILEGVVDEKAKKAKEAKTEEEVSLDAPDKKDLKKVEELEKTVKVKKTKKDKK